MIAKLRLRRAQKSIAGVLPIQIIIVADMGKINSRLNTSATTMPPVLNLFYANELAYTH
ncbi:hypothetical protein RSAG8_05746, partial [Rhizoctonia solani AG-8 WAC10335]